MARTVTTPPGNGNDHNFAKGHQEPNLDFTYEPHGPTAGAEEAEIAAQQTRALSAELEAKEDALLAANEEIARLTAQLAAKPKGKADA